MSGYILQNIKKNIRKFIVMLIMLIVCSTVVLFALEIVCDLSNELESRLNDLVAQDELQSMMLMIELGIVLLISFIFIIINNTYNVILFGREEEFNLLYRLGFDKKKIRKLLYGESVVLSIIAFVIGVVLATIISKIFINKFSFNNPVSLPIYVYLTVGVVNTIIYIYIVNRNLKNITIGLNEKHKEKTVNPNIIRKTFRMAFLGIVILAVKIVLPDSLFTKIMPGKEVLAKNIITVVALYLLVNAAILLVLKMLLYISKKYLFNSVYLAVEQNLFNFNKVVAIISSIMTAVTLFVSFQGIFYSIEETTRKYVKESTNYETMVLFKDPPKMSQDDLVQLLEQNKNSNSHYSVALTLNLCDQKGKNFTLSGIDESYYEMQKFYLADGTNIEDMYVEDDYLRIMYSSKKIGQLKLKMGDLVSNYKLDGKEYVFKVAVSYEPINIHQGFTSKRLLSKRYFDGEDKYNTIYFNKYSKEQVDSILSNFNKDTYTKYDMKSFIKSCVDQAIKGTEIIELILYVSMIFVASLVINLLVLSYSDRKKQYKELLILGIKKRQLLISMLIESSLIYVIGAVFGYFISLPIINIALDLVKGELIFETSVYLPYGLFGTVIGACYVIIFVFTYFLGKNLLSKNKISPNSQE